MRAFAIRTSRYRYKDQLQLLKREVESAPAPIR